MGQTVTLYFRDGTESTTDEAAINIVGDFLIVETPSEDGGLAEFYPAGSLRKAELAVTFEEETLDETAASEADIITPDFDGGASLS